MHQLKLCLLTLKNHNKTKQHTTVQTKSPFPLPSQSRERIYTMNKQINKHFTL